MLCGTKLNAAIASKYETQNFPRREFVDAGGRSRPVVLGSERYSQHSRQGSMEREKIL